MNYYSSYFIEGTHNYAALLLLISVLITFFCFMVQISILISAI